jgi:FlaA1/EpsC-like NDP-sugar epimerase
VLVTGAGGSIGSELCRQIHRYGPAELIMLDRDESALHAVQMSVNGTARLDDPDLCLVDIRDFTRLSTVFERFKPHVVFHAAALKHVPLLEMHPTEAVQTNVWGTLNVLKVAAQSGVERFVNISTDKAADPVNALGTSKRIAERLTAAFATEQQMPYLSVRFGNVLGSRGSVLETFRAQIEAGGPVTVTHPEITRYFMTVQEAVQLVIQAGAIGRSGEVLVLEMGTPVRIAEVAERLVAEARRPIKIAFTGLRPGEKMHEVLFAPTEVDERPIHPLISHCPVPPLAMGTVDRLDLRAPSEELLDRLRSLADASLDDTRDDVLIDLTQTPARRSSDRTRRAYAQSDKEVRPV